MKRNFYLGAAMILIVSLLIVGYGAWLNYSDENQIAMRMAERVLPLHGTKAQIRNIRPVVALDTINLTSNNMADAVALANGRVIEVLVRKNEHVKEGQPLFVLLDEEMPMKLRQADTAILRAEAELTSARNNYERYASLQKLNAVSRQQYDETEARWRAAEADYADAVSRREQLSVQAARQQVVSPIDGETLILYRQQGAYVTAGTSMALVGNFSSLYFSTPANDELSQHFFIGQEVNILFSARDFPKVYDTEYKAGNEGSRQSFRASLVSLSPPLSEKAAVRKAIWKVDNRSGLLEPQAYRGIRIQAANSGDALAVPLSAVHEKKVFVLSPQGLLEERSVETGLDDGKYIAIRKGLEAGEIVITSSGEGLEAGMKAAVTLNEGENG